MTFECGCTVTFLGSCEHRATRMDACEQHSSRDGYMERAQIVMEARREYWNRVHEKKI